MSPGNEFMDYGLCGQINIVHGHDPMLTSISKTIFEDEKQDLLNANIEEGPVEMEFTNLNFPEMMGDSFFDRTERLEMCNGIEDVPLAIEEPSKPADIYSEEPPKPADTHSGEPRKPADIHSVEPPKVADIHSVEPPKTRNIHFSNAIIDLISTTCVSPLSPEVEKVMGKWTENFAPFALGRMETIGIKQSSKKTVVRTKRLRRARPIRDPLLSRVNCQLRKCPLILAKGFKLDDSYTEQMEQFCFYIDGSAWLNWTYSEIEEMDFSQRNTELTKTEEWS